MSLGRVAVVALMVVGIASSCSKEAEPAPPNPTRTPGEVATTWQPSAPAEPVGEETVSSTYASLLDAVTAALEERVGGLQWSAPTTRTETFEGVCAVTVERSASSAITPLGAAAANALSAVLSSADFGSAAMAEDPGGAVRYLADGPDGALFELRSKGTTTVAVRVPTTASSC